MYRLPLIVALLFSPFAAQGFEIKFGGSSQTEIPKWVANPVSDDAGYIYGIGEGESLAKATQSALNNISGKLATVVSSNISANTTLSQGKTSVYFSEDVSTKTFDTKISSYEVVQSAAQGSVYYAMVKMSRSAFVNDTMARLKTIDDRINNKISVASKVSRLRHYLALNEIKPDVTEASTLVLLLQAASPSFDGDRYLSAYRKYQAAAEEMLFKMHFNVDAGPGMSSVAEMLVGLLGAENLSASTEKGSQADATIVVTGTVKRSTLFSEYTTQLRVNIQVKDGAGRKINSKEHVVAGSSLTNFDSSLITATNLLQQKLENEGVLVLLGLQVPPS